MGAASLLGTQNTEQASGDTRLARRLVFGGKISRYGLGPLGGEPSSLSQKPSIWSKGGEWVLYYCYANDAAQHHPVLMVVERPEKE